MAIPDPGRGDPTTLAGHLSRRGKTLNRKRRKTGFKSIPWWALTLKAENSGPCDVCYPQNRLFTHLRRYGCVTLERCGVVLDRGRRRTAPGSQLQTSPTSVTDCDSDPSGLTMDGQSSANGQHALKIIQWNAEAVRLKKTELQHFLKHIAIDVCCIQETHLSNSHRFFFFFHKELRGFSTRQGKPTKGRSADPGEKQHPCFRNPEIWSSWSRHGVSGSQTGSDRNTSDCLQHLFTIWQADPATQHQSRTQVLDYHRKLQQSPTNLGLWAAQQQRRKVENRITENRLILINKPDDPDTYSRTWGTIRTDLAVVTDDIQGIAEREVSSQLGGSDHRPVIISIKGQMQSHRNKLPASWNNKEAK